MSDKVSNLDRVTLSDSTLRDGSHAISHQLSRKQVGNYCINIDSVGLDWVEVGHGNGLGASSQHIGLSAETDEVLLTEARSKLKATKLSVHLMPGIASLGKDVEMAMSVGVDVFRVASHCSEADTTVRHLEYVRGKDKQAIGVLMMCHMLGPEALVKQALMMQKAGAQGIMVMDSAGALRLHDVRERICALVENLDVPIGMHAHNNLGLAVANSLAALDSGALIIDACAAGFGAGAGNAPMEVLIPLLGEQGRTTADHLSYFRAVNAALLDFIPAPQTLTTSSVATGMAGLFSGFLKPIVRESAKYDLDPFVLIEALGKEHPVAGQEDLVIEMAKKLSGK